MEGSVRHAPCTHRCGPQHGTVPPLPARARSGRHWGALRLACRAGSKKAHPAAANLAMLKMRLWAPLCADTHGRLHNRAGSAVRPQALGAGRQEVSEEEAAMYLRFGNLIGDSPEETADVLAQRGGAAAAAATAIRGFVPRRAATHRASRVMGRLRTAAHLSVRARGRRAPARQAPASARSSACGTQHLPARQVGVLPGLRAVSGVPAHAATVAAGRAARKRRMPGWRPWSRACGGPRPRRAARRRTRRWTAQRPRRAAPAAAGAARCPCPARRRAPRAAASARWQAGSWPHTAPVVEPDGLARQACEARQHARSLEPGG